MAVVQMLILAADLRPDISQIVECSEIKLDFGSEHIDLAAHTGFLPVKVEGRQTGFEYYFGPIPEGELPPVVTQFGSDQMTARTGSDMSEMFASLVFLKAAAKCAGAAYVYPDDGTVIAPGEVESYLDAQISEVRKYMK